MANQAGRATQGQAAAPLDHPGDPDPEQWDKAPPAGVGDAPHLRARQHRGPCISHRHISGTMSSRAFLGPCFQIELLPPPPGAVTPSLGPPSRAFPLAARTDLVPLANPLWISGLGGIAFCQQPELHLEQGGWTLGAAGLGSQCPETLPFSKPPSDNEQGGPAPPPRSPLTCEIISHMRTFFNSDPGLAIPTTGTSRRHILPKRSLCEDGTWASSLPLLPSGPGQGPPAHVGSLSLHSMCRDHRHTSLNMKAIQRPWDEVMPKRVPSPRAPVKAAGEKWGVHGGE